MHVRSTPNTDRKFNASVPVALCHIRTLLTRVADEMRPPDEAAPDRAMAVLACCLSLPGTASKNTNSGVRR